MYFELIQMSTIETKFGILHPTNYVMSWMIEISDDNSLSKWHYLQHCKPRMSTCLQGMANHAKFTISVGDTTQLVYKYYWARQMELVTLNTMISVVGGTLEHPWGIFVWERSIFPSLRIGKEERVSESTSLGIIALISSSHAWDIY